MLLSYSMCTEQITTRVEKRFWKKGRKTSSCWIWTGAKNNHGYGRFWNGSDVVLAHRHSWSICFGRPPVNHILHQCDTPACVRPSHLREGTQSDNLRDMYFRNRHCKSRLGAKNVSDIRRRLASGEPGITLAKEYGVTPSAIYHIKNGHTWAWHP